MDPKMDSGYLAPGETLDAEYDVMRSLLPEEVIGIMDQLLCHEVDLQHAIPTRFPQCNLSNILPLDLMA